MIVEFLSAARALDDRIARSLGRPYHVILGVALVAEIVRRVHELVHRPEHGGSLLVIVLSIAVGLLLLLHQLAELAERAARRRG